MFDSIKLYKEEDIDVAGITKSLDKYGYTRCAKISEEGDYSLIGETLIIYPLSFTCPVRVDINERKILSIKSIDLLSFKNIYDHNTVIILPVSALRKSSIKKLDITYGERPIEAFVDIEPGDFVVHLDYGIGKYLGMQRVRVDGKMNDFFIIEFKGNDKLYVRSKDLHKIQRYISFHRKAPFLNSLKGKQWQNTKTKAQRSASHVAKELLILQAKRESMRSHPFSKDGAWQNEVEKKFPYKETPDQIKSAEDVKKDMEKSSPMDRLLCGDVGYGKTEVVLRAAFKAVMDNKQVAILVPTTILAEQHTNTFKKRLSDYPVNVEMLNRFCTIPEEGVVLEGLKDGKVDIVIGTHRLLSDDVKFRDLGLLVIDEEQRFGVWQKEKIKKMKINVDVLTLTATPIPRTLYMALMGGKDISIIETPPLERHPVETQIIEYDKVKIKGCIEKELARGGQVYYVHNRVDSIDILAGEISRLVPGARLMIGHGQMSSKVLEKTMLKFIKGEIDVLVCTKIIESGIDIPNANTMIINEADKFGLAELYQLRGRIGRFDRQAYAYLVVKNISGLTYDVQERFNAIKKFQKLGSGFKLAMRDLEMRGAGNILGLEQSGFIDEIGFDLYCRLLSDEIAALKVE